jgi:hypothetical protein
MTLVALINVVFTAIAVVTVVTAITMITAAVAIAITGWRKPAWPSLTAKAPPPALPVGLSYWT